MAAGPTRPAGRRARPRRSQPRTQPAIAARRRPSPCGSRRRDRREAKPSRRGQPDTPADATARPSQLRPLRLKRPRRSPPRPRQWPRPRFRPCRLRRHLRPPRRPAHRPPVHLPQRQPVAAKPEAKPSPRPKPSLRPSLQLRRTPPQRQHRLRPAAPRRRPLNAPRPWRSRLKPRRLPRASSRPPRLRRRVPGCVSASPDRSPGRPPSRT